MGYRVTSGSRRVAGKKFVRIAFREWAIDRGKPRGSNEGVIRTPGNATGGSAKWNGGNRNIIDIDIDNKRDTTEKLGF